MEILTCVALRYLMLEIALYWNSISGFDLNVCVVIGVSFYICPPNFVEIGDRWCSYDVISNFQDGSHRVGNILPGSGLATVSV